MNDLNFKILQMVVTKRGTPFFNSMAYEDYLRHIDKNQVRASVTLVTIKAQVRHSRLPEYQRLYIDVLWEVLQAPS